MELTIVLIRGGLTRSGQTGILSGAPEESLLQQSADGIMQRALGGVYPAVEFVYSSPAKCCIETAQLIYPPPILARATSELRAYDYGIYNHMTARRIKKDKQFPDWAASAGAAAFPGGESYAELSARIHMAFRKIINMMLSEGFAVVGIVTHRLVISAILQKIYAPRRSYADWKAQNGGGYSISFNSGTNTGFVKDFF